MLKSNLIASLLLLIATIGRAQPAEPTPAEIKQMLQERVDATGKGVGIVLGLIDESGTKIIQCGEMGRTNQTLNGDTLFEIGSVSKVLTASLLADMVQRGEVKLDDPVSKYLPTSVHMPTRNGKEITLLDLATQSSGLPRLPDNLESADERNPYVDYTVDQLYEFLSDYNLKRDIGVKYEYSNLGVGLLGHVLALKAGTNYEALVKERVCRPLGMTNTVVMITPELKARLAIPHNESGRPVSNWDIVTLAGAGGLRSTVNDMLKFLSANMGVLQSPLTTAMDLAQEAHRPAGGPNMKIGLCWHINLRHGTELVWHNGETGGYHSFIGFDKKSKRGVVILSNSANDIDDIGFHLLNPKFNLAKVEVKKPRNTIALSADALVNYVGVYRLNPAVVFNVRNNGDQLLVQLTGQSYLEVYPESESEFFYEAVDAQLTFNKDKQGRITSLVLHQNGFDQKAKKISDQPLKQRVAVKLDPKTYDDYVGKYELGLFAEFTIKRSGNNLLAKLTGQSFLGIFPQSATEFFYKEVEAQLTFEKDANGKVTALILHQNGIDQKAKKVQ
ncbi:serine hydrolase [Pedosphaera parvula]|uniref:Beta-lactamase n=1 Tax=Pedosphaera parvula (strain Ellin514) TaxID=320771 RepID=B9XIS7_PEDPL|nr:serine hydrolase [Pedosphaera parvula]EEF60340.1 beta-lactamase [Pedosphaera parvula Ellin514]